MNSILFLCHGNICRSPMAEFIMKDLLARKGLAGDMTIDSAAVSREEIGNDMFPPAKRILTKHGIPFSSRAARQIEEEDLKRYNIIIAMDRSNLRMLKRLFGERSTADVRLLMSYAGADRDVEDPWYTGDFDQAYTDIVSGCTGLFREIYE